MTRPRAPRPATGVEAIAGRILLDTALTRDVDERVRAVVEKQLGAILPGRVVAAGVTDADRTASPKDLATLLPSAAIAAIGLDPDVATDPPPQVVWTLDGNRLLVQPSRVTAELGDGLIELTIPVSCDQAPDTAVTVAFLTGSPDRPTGGVTVAEDHPRGPAAVVEIWHDPLIALAWDTVQRATSALAGVGATDTGGRPLVTNALSITADGVGVVPMGRHAFLAAGRTGRP